ncbi:hypothetical protein BWI93_19730, partial [Siphonobacter sp. BAB-5385]
AVPTGRDAPRISYGANRIKPLRGWDLMEVQVFKAVPLVQPLTAACQSHASEVYCIQPTNFRGVPFELLKPSIQKVIRTF